MNAVSGRDCAYRVDLRPKVRTHFGRPICAPDGGVSEIAHVRIRPEQEGAVCTRPAIVEKESRPAPSDECRWGGENSQRAVGGDNSALVVSLRASALYRVRYARAS